MSNPVILWEICSKKPERAIEFYRKIFNWDIVHLEEKEFWECKCGEVGINGGIFPAQGEMPNYVAIFVRVDDPGAYLEKAVSLGATKIVGPIEIPGDCIYAMFVDPAGNPIGLIKSLKS